MKLKPKLKLKLKPKPKRKRKRSNIPSHIVAWEALTHFKFYRQ